MNQQETRNNWRDCSWYCAQSGNIHTCVQGRIHSRCQNGKGLLTQSQQDSNMASRTHTSHARAFAPAPRAISYFGEITAFLVTRQSIQGNRQYHEDTNKLATIFCNFCTVCMCRKLMKCCQLGIFRVKACINNLIIT